MLHLELQFVSEVVIVAVILRVLLAKGAGTLV